ncbi:hypothetical protein ITI46_27325 [Streptomyces oryzae]|uniref:Uncharacterized protein n=1 Tax=Streptomyces oryzae TaxID=1434886 RepID=A0ABS3XIU7_9ACTN|nr:hypothetical protein [Streptomyces oryzae]
MAGGQVDRSLAGVVAAFLDPGVLEPPLLVVGVFASWREQLLYEVEHLTILSAP